MNTAAFRITVRPPLWRPPSACVTALRDLRRSVGPLGDAVEGLSGFPLVRGASRSFTTVGPEREAFTSFGSRQVPVKEKEKLVGGVFSSVAGERGPSG